MSIWPFHAPTRSTPLRAIVVRGLPDGADVTVERVNPTVSAHGRSVNGLADLGAVPDNLPSHAINLHIRAAGYRDYDINGLVLNSGNLQLMVGLPIDTPGLQQVLPPLVAIAPVFVPLPALRVRGQFFEQVTGARWTGIETSEFNLLNIFQHQGVAGAEPIAAQRQQLGFNLVRVWTRYTAGTGAGEFLDIDYTRVGAFLDFLAGHGLYVDLTAYTGRDAFLAGHWEALGAAVQGHSNVLGSLVNENDQPNNTIDLTPYRPWPGVLCSKGSNGSQAWPPNPNQEGWAWGEFHDNGAPEWQRKGSHGAMEVADAYHYPVITNEQTRYPDNETSLQYAFDDGQASVLLIAGSCFHSVQGKTSSLFTGVTLDAAKAHVAGMQSLPLACQDAGGYVHRADLEGPNDLRVYQRGNNPACIARVRK